MTHRERHLAEGLFDLKLNTGAGLCMVKCCRKPHAPQKMGLCYQHYMARWRMRSPKRSAFATLRDHAKARGLEFSISFDYYTGLCDAHRYFDAAAVPKGETLTIERMDITKGYVMGNLTVISHSENVIRGNRDRFLPEYVQALLARKRAKAQGGPCASLHRDEDANPF